MEIQANGKVDVLHISANLLIKGFPNISEEYLIYTLAEMGSELICHVGNVAPDVLVEMQWDKFVTYRNTKIIVEGYVKII